VTGQLEEKGMLCMKISCRKNNPRLINPEDKYRKIRKKLKKATPVK
jgi:hypothetical protein